MEQGEKVESKKSTLVTPAPCPQMNDADTTVKSGFVPKPSAVNCSKVISLHIPEKADTEMSNKEHMKVENDPDRATEVRQRGCDPRRQQELGWAGILHRSVVKENSYQARCPPALGSGPSPAFHGHVHSALQRGAGSPPSQQTHPRNGLRGSCGTRCRSIHTGRPPRYWRSVLPHRRLASGTHQHLRKAENVVEFYFPKHNSKPVPSPRLVRC